LLKNAISRIFFSELQWLFIIHAVGTTVKNAILIQKVVFYTYFAFTL